MNLSTFSCHDNSLGCSCGDCPPSIGCFNTVSPVSPKGGSCAMKSGSVKTRKQKLDFYVMNDGEVNSINRTLDSKLSAPTAIPEPVANCLMSGETHTTDCRRLSNYYGFAEQRLQQVVKSENILVDPAAELSNGSFQNAGNFVQEHLPASVEEPIGEPREQTYAAIICN
ncbi:hypothetical protein M0R45_030801 [Rubus argutus]|uniref:Uncharacterized protein n=1 Tax=Rubus argutus TaxID=59490 RepID=A0AAW1WCX4_RUBAR